MTDVIDRVLNLEPGDLIYDLRRQRPDVIEQLQRAHDLLFTASEDTAPTRAERVGAAYRVALSAGVDGLSEHYLSLLGNDGLADAVRDGRLDSERGSAIIAHARTLTERPRELTQDNLLALQSVGLSVPEIVTVSQLISFVNFQARVVAGLDAMKG